jgi:hypothetical protein
MTAPEAPAGGRRRPGRWWPSPLAVVIGAGAHLAAGRGTDFPAGKQGLTDLSAFGGPPRRAAGG